MKKMFLMIYSYLLQIFNLIWLWIRHLQILFWWTCYQVENVAKSAAFCDICIGFVVGESMNNPKRLSTSIPLIRCLSSYHCRNSSNFCWLFSEDSIRFLRYWFHLYARTQLLSPLNVQYFVLWTCFLLYAEG